jgi:Phosphodiester glycosidase
MSVERQRLRVRLADGAETTVHVTSHPLRSPGVRVVRLDRGAPFESWCAEHGVREAISGGFLVKPELEPLGELWTRGRRCPYRPFSPPWGGRRGAVAIGDGGLSIDRRDRLSTRPRDLLEAGPLLVREGRSAVAGVEDPEGFSAAADEFDQDLTAGREPRLAIALAAERVLAVAAEGRASHEAGLTLWEFADVIAGLGASAALNLDGGSAGVVVSGGERLNVPRDDEGAEMGTSSPTVTGVVLDGR